MNKWRCPLVIVMAGILAGWLQSAVADTEASATAFVDEGGDFSLTDQNGFRWQLSDFAGKVVLLTFGYTHCPDICPMTMFTLQRAVRMLDADADRAQVLFVTLDPERDNAERLQAYVGYFNAGFIGLSGAVSEITKIAGQYGIHFEKENFDEAGSYSISHNAVIFLIGPQGKVRALFRIDAPAEAIAAGVKHFLSE